jgi:hypothetical protein
MLKRPPRRRPQILRKRAVLVVLLGVLTVGGVVWGIQSQLRSQPNQATPTPTISQNRPTPTVAPSRTPNSADFITHSPINLAKTSRLSKFRSCVGHDYSGFNAAGQLETNRSMKHYVVTTTASPEAYMPFDGRIAEIRSERTAYGKQIWLTTEPDNGWIFIFFHVNPAPGLAAGSSLKAGQLLGTAPIRPNDSFDFTLARFGADQPAFDTPFAHMTDTLMAQFAQAGLTLENLVIPKAARDKRPCRFGTYDAFDWISVR